MGAWRFICSRGCGRCSAGPRTLVVRRARRGGEPGDRLVQDPPARGGRSDQPGVRALTRSAGAGRGGRHGVRGADSDARRVGHRGVIVRWAKQDGERGRAPTRSCSSSRPTRPAWRSPAERAGVLAHRQGGGRDGARSARWSRASRTARRGAAPAPAPPAGRAAAAPQPPAARRAAPRRRAAPPTAPAAPAAPTGRSAQPGRAPPDRRARARPGRDRGTGQGRAPHQGRRARAPRRRPRRRRRPAAPTPRRRPPAAPHPRPRRPPRRAGEDGEERVPMSRLRQRIAERLRAGAAHGRHPHDLQRGRHDAR